MPNPPRPSALRAISGAAAHNPGRTNRLEPKPALGADPPPWLPRRGVAWSAWRRLLPLLLDMRVLTVADAEALALGCMALRDYLAAEPGTRARENAWRQYFLMLSAFGMTPSARTKVQTVAPAVLDPVDAWRKSGAL